jgi:hypothetical protein
VKSCRASGYSAASVTTAADGQATLAAPRGTELQLTADGADEASLITELVQLIEGKFGEDFVRVLASAAGHRDPSGDLAADEAVRRHVRRPESGCMPQ